jgi:predicted PurR-regulated permease PerM
MRDDAVTHPTHRGDSVAHTVRVIAILAAAVLVVWLLSDIVLLIFLAVLIAVILRGISDKAAQHTGVSEGHMLAIVAILATVILLGLLYYIGPKLATQTGALISQIRGQVEHLRQAYGNTAWGQVVFQHLSPSGSMESHLSSYVKTIATSTIGSLVTAFVLIVTSLYFAISPGVYVDGVVRLFPLRFRARAHHLMLDIGSTLRRWSLGQLIDMTVVGVLTGIGLAVLGIPMPLALGLLAGLFTFVPYFGAIAAAVPAMLVALNIGWQTSLWVLLLFLFCHGVEGYLVSPLVQRRTVDLPPALTILSMTILGTLFGPLGVILGTPVAAASLAIVREAYIGEVLKDPDFPGPAAH